MLYTGKGDDGTTSAFACDQRFSKTSAIAEALGALDEVNSFLGIVKVNPLTATVTVSGVNRTLREVVDQIQQNLFIIQAEVAGSDKHIVQEKVTEVEGVVNAIEADLPPIKSFFVPGGTELAAHLDFSRTLCRRAERRVVGAFEEGKVSVQKETLAYLNRLSSLLYALARQVNHKSGITEEPPTY